MQGSKHFLCSYLGITIGKILINIDVFNVAGRYVRKLAGNISMNAGSQTVAWDGRDGDGRLCPMGLYIVRIRAAGAEKVTTVGIVK